MASLNPPPLTGLRVLEFAGLAPGPFAGLLLADAGASVLRIDRPSSNPSQPAVPTPDILARHKSSICLDLKSPSGVALARKLATQSDILIDPFRPGVLEKLGLGPDVLRQENERLVYARMTGFRRDGRYAAMAGHDINYLAVSGVLAMLGRKGEKPTPPLNILGDFAGGGATLFQGILMALLVRDRTGKGQVVEANMVDGASYLATYPRFSLKTPMLDQPRGENMLDTGCPWYDTYETRDGGYMAVGAIEPQFFEELLKGVGLQGKGWERRRYDRDNWPELRDVLTKTFKHKTRAEWERIFDGTDACCTPVFGYGEMEKDMEAKGGDQRPPVTLRETPMLAVRKDASDPSHGQGEGILGEGYAAFALAPGEGGEKVLKDWLGWTRGREFDVQNGALILAKRETPKL
jgi:alpha-methylacyl-CoA racemase